MTVGSTTVDELPVDELPIEALRIRSRFVDTLPGDAVLSNHRRTVLDACYSRTTPTPVSAPRLEALVPEVAALLDLAPVETPTLIEVLAGNRVLPGTTPYASCYGGHQFGRWAGQLGDGRAITLTEIENSRGESWEVQLKGAGPTPYSRRADGRAVLRSSLREFICSEAMHHLGVPTTRALSLVTTGDQVVRDLLYDGNAAPEPGAIVCRVAPSFLRFGTFELHATRGEQATLRRLVNFTLERFFPRHAAGTPADIAAFFGEVCRRTAHLMVEWMRVGFVHGVMNTDNMSILGLTIDYGPYGWLESVDPNWTPNITDASGRRYRFGNQPQVAHWNLLQLGQALAVLCDDVAPLEAALADYVTTFTAAYRRMQLAKLGLTEQPGQSEPDDDQLLHSLASVLTVIETDMTLFYRTLAALSSAADASPDELFTAMREAHYAPDAASAEAITQVAPWLERYLARARREDCTDQERRQRMNRVNPLYVPRNYVVQLTIERVEAGDRAALAELLDVLRRPYDEQPGRAAYAGKRPEWARHRAGCSMLSCSS